MRATLLQSAFTPARAALETQVIEEVVRAATSLPCYDSGFDYHKGLVEFRLDGITPTRQAAETLLAAMLLACARIAGKTPPKTWSPSCDLA